MNKKKFFEDENASSPGHLSLEMIAFQSDDYPKQVEAVVEEILNDGLFRFRRRDDPRLKKIEELTFNRTGIKIRLVTNDMLAATIPFYPNQHSAIVGSDFRGKLYEKDGWKSFMKEQIKILDKADGQVGTVDLKECRVSGIFSQYVNPVYMNFRQLAGLKINAREITGIFLHELGHCFTAYEYCNRMNRTNVVLADIVRNILEQPAPDKNYVFRELKKVNKKTTDAELEEIFSGENVILGRATMRFLGDTAKSALPVEWYSESGNETLADNFATRWGYGPDVVSGLEKLGLGSYFASENSFIGALISSIATLCAIVYLMLLIGACLNPIWTAFMTAGIFGGLSGGFMLVPAMLLCLFLYLVVMGTSSHFSEMTYDDTKYRYKRIRNQLVEMLKHVDDLPAAQLDQTVQQIKQLDDLVDDRGNYKNFFGIVIDFLSPRGREISADLKMQRLLESLAANDLYIKAALLRQTA